MGNFWISADASIALAKHQDVILVVEGATQWTDAIWDDYIAENSRIDAARVRAALLYMSEAAPTAAQRKRIRDTIAPGVQVRSALITDSGIARAASAAFGLMSKLTQPGLEIRAFAPTAARDATRWLGEVQKIDEASLFTVFFEMMRAVGYGDAEINAMKVDAGSR